MRPEQEPFEAPAVSRPTIGGVRARRPGRWRQRFHGGRARGGAGTGRADRRGNRRPVRGRRARGSRSICHCLGRPHRGRPCRRSRSRDRATAWRLRDHLAGHLGRGGNASAGGRWLGRDRPADEQSEAQRPSLSSHLASLPRPRPASVPAPTSLGSARDRPGPHFRQTPGGRNRRSDRNNRNSLTARGYATTAGRVRL